MGRERQAWAAGFFDGEGCFSYTPKGGYATVRISQVQREPLDRFRECTGVGNVFGPRKTGGYGKSTQFAFSANGNGNVSAIATSLWPFLGAVKREQSIRTLRASSRHRTIGPAPSRMVPSTLDIIDPSACFNTTFREDVAWAAGFFDAEGCFSYPPRGDTPTIAITQVDRQVLDRFHDTVGVGKIYGPYQPKAERRLPQHQYRVSGHERVQVLYAMLWPFLSTVKRQQGLAVVERGRQCCKDHPKVGGQRRCGECRREMWARWRERNGRPPRPTATTGSPLP